jgi:PiT family inorganic phosphate transporter
MPFTHFPGSETLTPLLIILIVMALIFDFLNGVHDSSNIVATMISSRALRPQTALAMTAVESFVVRSFSV